MKFVVGNIQTKLVIGGADNLYKIDWIDTLREYMRERPNGYQYASFYKKRQWDGYTYFLTKTGYFATGFLPYMVEYVKELAPDIELQFEDTRETSIVFEKELITDLGENYIMRPYQSKVVEAVKNSFFEYGDIRLPFHRGVIDAATNSGKTVMMAGIVMNMVKPNVLLMIDRDLIFRQLVQELSIFFKVGTIGDGIVNFTDFTIAKAKTLHNRLDSLNVQKALHKVTVLIIDEGHKAATTTYKEIFKNVPNASCRLVMSGSPLDMDDKVTKMTIVGLTGKRLVKITNAEMIEAGVSQKPIVHFHLVNDENIWRQQTYEEQQSEYYQSVKHHEIVRGIIGDQDKYTMITFQFRNHGYNMLNYLKQNGAVDIDCTHGQDGYRFNKLERFKNKQITTLLASMIVKEGLNIPVIQKVIRTETGKSKITSKQVTGRSIRTDGVNDTVEMHDFWVVGSYMEKHSAKRVKQYMDEGYEIIYHYPANKHGKPQ